MSKFTLLLEVGDFELIHIDVTLYPILEPAIDFIFKKDTFFVPTGKWKRDNFDQCLQFKDKVDSWDEE